MVGLLEHRVWEDTCCIWSVVSIDRIRSDLEVAGNLPDMTDAALVASNGERRLRVPVHPLLPEFSAAENVEMPMASPALKSETRSRAAERHTGRPGRTPDAFRSCPAGSNAWLVAH
jgi:hypothetical protein